MPPRNASVRGDGFRFYAWPGGDTPLNREYNAVEASDLLSVTSIKSLAGENYQLVAWKINNVVNLAMGTRKVTKIGPRGGVKEIYVADGPFPGEFTTRMIETRGKQEHLDEVRAWLKATADEPRDIAAVRGSIVHKMIEEQVPLAILDEDLIRQYFATQWAQERRKVKPDVLADDVHFVHNAMEQYGDMRTRVPFIVLAREPQIYNLTAGYGGSADVILWFLGEWAADGTFTPLPAAERMMAPLQKAANAGVITLADVRKIGGTLGLGDWKTSKGVYTSHIIQAIAYMSGEFVAEDGLIDKRLSDLLRAALLGLVIHIRPDHWSVSFFPFRQDILNAFLGSVAYARFLALYKEPTDLFTHSLEGKAEGTEVSEVIDDDSE